MAVKRALATQFKEDLSKTERDKFITTMFIMKWADVNITNIDQFRSLNVPVAKILVVYTGKNEAKKADSNIAYGLKAKFLLVRDARVMLNTNLWKD
ncbi:unnamed protein product [Rhizophagus irregularis]|nr:unnamed protein product [Rhizophagus irregularis]